MRHAEPWYRAAANAWYVEIGGKQTLLGKHPENAPVPKKSPKTKRWNVPASIRLAFANLLAETPTDPPPPVVLTIAVLCDRFLAFSKEHNVEKDFKSYEWLLNSFCDLYGGVLASEATPDHVHQWLASKPSWNGTRRHAIMAVKRAFNWADVQAKILSPNPLRGLRNSKARSRARFLSPEQRKIVLAAIPDWQFRCFVEAMQESGCRPSEVRRVEAKDCDLTLGIWRLTKHKTVNKTGKPRVVYCTPRLLEITKELIAKNPVGPLFRGPRFNRPFGLHGIVSRFRRLRDKLAKEHPDIDFKAVCSYAYRHSVADAAIKKGLSIEQTALLLGTSPDMVHHHYQHAAEDVAYMRELAAKATAS